MRSLIICLTKYYFGDQIENGKVSSIYGGEERWIQSFGEET
jgi:hypothetical protein